MCASALGADGRTLLPVALLLPKGRPCSSSGGFDGGGPICRLHRQFRSRWRGLRVCPGLRLPRRRHGTRSTRWNPPDPKVAFTQVIDPVSGDFMDGFPGVLGFFPTDEPDVVVAIFIKDGHARPIRRGRPRSGRTTEYDPGFRADNVWIGDGRVDRHRNRRRALHARARTRSPRRHAGVAIVRWSCRPDVQPRGHHARRSLHGRIRLPGRRRGRPAVARHRRSHRGALHRGTALSTSPVVSWSPDSSDGTIVELDPITLQPIGTPYPGITGGVDGT